MNNQFEYVDAAQAVITPRIRGERTSDGELVQRSHTALEVNTNANGNGIVLTGGKDELIEFATRIIEQATITELRREQMLVGWSAPHWKRGR